MNDGLDAIPGSEGATPDRPHVQALRAAYLRGRLVVSADCVTLARARLARGHPIDARDVAESMLRWLSSRSVRPPDGDSGAS